jgi:hypothetical protein
MTTNDKDQDSSGAPTTEAAPRHPEQDHPVQDAHGGSMAPGLVDDTGHLVSQDPPATADE